MTYNTENIESVSKDTFANAGKMSKWAFVALFLAAVIEVGGMLIGEETGTYQIWKTALTVEALLLSAYSFLTLCSSIANFKGRKLKINDVVDNAFGCGIGESHSVNYYDNDEIKEGTRRLLYNTAESCFFSYKELKSMEREVYSKTLLPLAVLISGLLINRAEVIMAIFRITAIIVLIVQAVRFFYTTKELEILYERMLSTLKHEIGKASQFNAESINYSLEYETVMAWYGEKIPDKVYTKLNEKLTNEWNNLKKTFVIK